MLPANSARDPFHLQRFVDAQEHVIESVLSELTRGHKYGHWMWFIFPQMKGLGRTSASEFYGISSLEEAVAYLRHPVLGPRLMQCTGLVNAVEGSDAEEIFSEVDAMKFRSSMTLFSQVDPGNRVFAEALEKYFAGVLDSLTMHFLQDHST